MITIDDFAKIELKVGTVLEAEEIEESEKLIKLKIDLGPAPDGAGQDIRQILAGIKKWYKAKRLIGKQVVVVANLEPRIMMGFESAGMLLAADFNKPILLKPFQKVPPGTKVR